MNTRNAYALRVRAAALGGQQHATRGVPFGLGTPAAVMQGRPAPASGFVAAVDQVDCADTGIVRPHPLADRATNARLARCEESVKGRFDAIVPTLKALSGLQHEQDFAERAQAMIEERLGHRLPDNILNDAWVAGLDLKALYAHCVFAAVTAAAAQFSQDLKNQIELVQDTNNFFLDCGFHAVDISPCADGRLKGLMRYILRLPLTSFTRRKAYAGALFDVETDVRHWGETELRRFREGVPTTPEASTRYLKVAIYHYSTSAPRQEGCAAHGSDDNKAIEAALERLYQFRNAIENAYCCGASTDLLLIGVDTDTDAIKLHVPDANGNLSAHRFVDNASLFTETLHLSADQAHLAVHEALRKASQTGGWGQGQGEPHDGMRRLIVNLLINNLSQIEYVRDLHGGRYADIGHAERYINVGDDLKEMQMRNVAYYAHLHTLEEGVADMDVGIKIFSGLNVKHGLPAPVAIHYRYDARVPGARERATAKARRVRDALHARYAELHAQGLLVCHLSVQDLPTGSPIETIETLNGMKT
ncbi:MAG: carboxysome shell carbonic anhydrase [Gammaproteobacteria bacterium]|nr:carboxysome shell carbonic anhydrase [Rhodocyclaceae bacterium]MBU3907881.1 carboxysome shell carbonic anhydrase [Gammaproteobacteria bacterium]MBU3988211.1 carboxysome shell carbonic anhydrase [Gammaproteobacteria bacterium]MBU4005882.1 carboxysome shell carbonic anhydrase [Gammaproteobacteria bacterium]MBU4095975.1 carboxysome shell carbonic anhydrase [Gammaproteobacteria bacterium]